MHIRSNPLPMLLLGLPLAVASSSALAQSTSAAARATASASAAEPQFTQLGAHVHGRVTINLAVEGGTLSVEMDAPAINVVGFERAPRDAAEKSVVAGVDRWLASGVGIVGVPAGAGCTRSKVDYEAPKPGGAADTAHDHDHDHEHDAAGAKESEAHADYEARFTYTCTNPAALAWADLWLVRRLRNVAEVEVNLVTAQGQSQLTVAGDAPRVALK